MADDAVCCELLSASNSLIIRENTGNFFIFDSEMPLRLPNYAGSIGVFQQIPYPTEQGILIAEQGIIFRDQGTFTANQGNSSRERRSAKSPLPG